jgi:hypothetical protein
MNYHEIDMFLYKMLLYWKYFFSCCSYFGQVILRIPGMLPQKESLERTHRESVFRKKQDFVTFCSMHRGMQQMEVWFKDSLS